ncbi:MAG: restriction endonuclease [Patescibacteria group bacterium]|nr:restriction endonuclease [Patescibacteria group bacterium]
MDISQAKGYLFEYVVQNLLKKSGYVKVRMANIRGRGGDHQIDAYGLLSIPTPFIYPIRLICEAKNYGDKIGLGKIRDFVGVMKDISEKYTTRKNGKYERFSDSGCYFSTKGFTMDAQKYAWAQNIFLVSHNGIDRSNEIVKVIDEFLSSNQFDGLNKGGLIERFKVFFERRFDDLAISFTVGIVNGKYPTVIVGNKGLVDKIKQFLPSDSDSFGATKTSREWNETDTYFNVFINELGEEIKVSVPNFIAKHIVNKIDRSRPGNKIFYIDVPVLSKIRRFVTIDVSLGEFETADYLDKLRRDS